MWEACAYCRGRTQHNDKSTTGTSTNCDVVVALELRMNSAGWDCTDEFSPCRCTRAPKEQAMRNFGCPEGAAHFKRTAHRICPFVRECRTYGSAASLRKGKMLCNCLVRLEQTFAQKVCLLILTGAGMKKTSHGAKVSPIAAARQHRCSTKAETFIRKSRPQPSRFRFPALRPR